MAQSFEIKRSRKCPTYGKQKHGRNRKVYTAGCSVNHSKANWQKEYLRSFYQIISLPFKFLIFGAVDRLVTGLILLGFVNFKSYIYWIYSVHEKKNLLLTFFRGFTGGIGGSLMEMLDMQFTFSFAESASSWNSTEYHRKFILFTH